MQTTETVKDGHAITSSAFPKPLIDGIKEAMIRDGIGLKENVRITLLHPGAFDCSRQMSLWYGGDIVMIELSIGQFIISACGDVIASLYRRSDNTEMFYVKDKANLGELGSELKSYVKTDDELASLINGDHPSYELEMSNNNWWECFGITNSGEFRDLMWALDADKLSDAVAEVLGGYSEYTEYL